MARRLHWVGPVGTISETALLVERAMRFRLARQGVLASNLANVDTPGFHRADLQFEAELSRAARLDSSQPGHQGRDAVEQPWRLERTRVARSPDGNSVDPDAEIIELSRNAGAFVEQAEILSRLFALTRMAIEGG